MPRKARIKKDGPESGEDSDEYRKRRDRNNLVIFYLVLKYTNSSYNDNFLGC